MPEVLAVLSNTQHCPEGAQHCGSSLDAIVEKEVGHAGLSLEPISPCCGFGRDGTGFDDQIGMGSNNQLHRLRHIGTVERAKSSKSREFCREISLLTS